MAYLSSPVVFPPSSSPPQALESRKRNIDGPEPLPKKRLFKKDFVIPAAHKLVQPELPVAEELKAVPKASKNPFVEDESEDLAHTDRSNETPLPSAPTESSRSSAGYKVCKTSSGRSRFVGCKETANSLSYEKLIAQRSTTAPGKATRSYYGIDIHKILEEARELNALKDIEKSAEPPSNPIIPSVEEVPGKRKQKYPLWTEKYRAKKFTDLVGDERTHRSVLRWLKSWDSIVFPGSGPSKPKQGIYEDNPERSHRKILMLTGPPGLGKTTLAHVCAKQAGYEVIEINASDERSKDIVRGKIKDCVGTENVRGINTQIGEQKVRKAGRPVCVVVDEVDGVVSGSGGGGEGGFVKALIDLVLLDQKNTKQGPSTDSRNRKKVDKFRLLRPMVLICNDVYHPSLRPLRASGLAEIVHVRKPPLEKIVTRMKHVFEKENIPADMDAVRRLCEATWGITSRSDRLKSSGAGEGDIRGVLVVGQWVASRLKASRSDSIRLTRQWLDQNVLADLASGGSGSRGIGRGGVKETVDRIFLEGGGFPKSIKTSKDDEIPSLAADKPQTMQRVTENVKVHTIPLLRSAIEQCGEHDRIVSDLFTTYPTCTYQDDTFLSKPNQAYEWLHFHDSISSKVFSQQDWELSPYLSQAALSFHNLFAATRNTHGISKDHEKEQDDDTVLPFSGPRADFACHESQKANHSNLQALQKSLSISLYRSFRSPQELATDLVPHLNHLLAPDVKPILIGGSGEQRSTATVRREGERDKVRRAAEAMAATGVTFERTRIEDDNVRSGYGGYVFRMEPPVDVLATFETATKTVNATSSRYAVRQVLDQELAIFRTKQAAKARLARSQGSHLDSLEFGDSENLAPEGHQSTTGMALVGTEDKISKSAIKRDFFGRVIVNEESIDAQQRQTGKKNGNSTTDQHKIWVTFHEGYSNAVRKPIGLRELMEGL